MTRRPIMQAELDQFEIEDSNGRLYWRGTGVVLEQRITLEGLTLALAIIGALSALVAAVWPILLHFKLFV